MCLKQFFRASGLILALFLASPTEIFAQNSFTPESQKPPPPPKPKMPPTNGGNSVPAIAVACPQQQRIGPFATSDEAEFAAQSARDQLYQTSSVYSRGFPESYFNPLQYYFYVYAYLPCN
jgi:hypothetical protein